MTKENIKETFLIINTLTLSHTISNEDEQRKREDSGFLYTGQIKSNNDLINRNQVDKITNQTTQEN